MNAEEIKELSADLDKLSVFVARLYLAGIVIRSMVEAGTTRARMDIVTDAAFIAKQTVNEIQPEGLFGKL